MDDIASDFEDALAGDQPDFESKPTAPLDLDQATQWVAQVARARRLREEYEEAHRSAVARLNARLSVRVEALNQQEEWYAEALEMFHRTAIAVDETALTIPTPAGTLKSTKTQPTWEFYDEEAFTAWAVENLPAVIAEPPPPPAPKVVKAEVKKALKDEATEVLKVAGTSDAVLTHDGAPVPGLRVLPAGRNYKVVTD
jgi:hypothetical protein